MFVFYFLIIYFLIEFDHLATETNIRSIITAENWYQIKLYLYEIDWKQSLEETIVTCSKVNSIIEEYAGYLWEFSFSRQMKTSLTWQNILLEQSL